MRLSKKKKLKLMKFQLRLIVTRRLNRLVILSTTKQMLAKPNYENLITNFASQKVREKKTNIKIYIIDI